MGKLVIAELRAAWQSWASVLIALITTSFAITLAVLVMNSMAATVASGVIPEIHVPALVFTPAWNLGLAIIGSLSVIGAITGLVVQARRGALARLSLAGATPGQVSRILLSQLGIVAVASAVIGIVVAILVQPAAMTLLLTDREIDAVAVVRVSPVMLLIAAGGFVLVALLGALRQSRVAANVPPVEAFRAAATGASTSRRQIGRWVGAVLLALAIVGLFAFVRVLAPSADGDGGDIVLQLSVMCVLLAGMMLSLAAPLSVGLLTRGWTALVPVRTAAWVIARSSVIVRGERLARTVTPIMLAIGLLVGLGAITSSIVAMLEQIGHPGLDNASIVSLLLLIALILIISVAGGVSVVLMMSRQRESELALAGIVGATTRQQVLVPVLEGVIITVTATILAVIMTAIGVAVFVSGLTALGLPVPVVFPWTAFAIIVGISAAVVIASTTLPVLPSLRKPARQVVAQLAAE